MLSYRHIHHAGNFADVVKHVVLVALLDAITSKSEPCYIHDSHAGAGIYDLAHPEAQYRREFEHGVNRLLDWGTSPVLVQRYLDIVRDLNPEQPTPRFYPGSPAIVREFLRRDDRLLLTELHPQGHTELRHTLGHDQRIQIHRLDAYQGLKTFLPPAEKHGLVLIDPPYEHKDEYRQAVNALRMVHTSWPAGICAVWYPVVSHGRRERFLDDCAADGLGKLLYAEFLVSPVSSEPRFVGCGIVIMNPPSQLHAVLDTALQWLCTPLQKNGEARASVSWLGNQ